MSAMNLEELDELVSSIAEHWIEPKTWTEKDKFNAEDYNRIWNNIYTVYSYAKEVSKYDMSDLPSQWTSSSATWGNKVTYTSMLLASMMNEFENAIEALNVYDKDFGTKKTFVGNGLMTNWQELNRLEHAIHKIYKMLIGETITNMDKHLAFTLGGVILGSKIFVYHAECMQYRFGLTPRFGANRGIF